MDGEILSKNKTKPLEETKSDDNDGEDQLNNNYNQLSGAFT